MNTLLVLKVKIMHKIMDNLKITQGKSKVILM